MPYFRQHMEPQEISFSPWGWPNTGTDCSGRFSSLHPCILGYNLKLSGQVPWQPALGGPACSEKVGEDNPERSLPTSAILWFYGSVTLEKKKRKAFLFVFISLQTEIWKRVGVCVEVECQHHCLLGSRKEGREFAWPCIAGFCSRLRGKRFKFWSAWPA